MILLGTLIKLAMSAQSQFPEEVQRREAELSAQLSLEAQQLGMDLAQFVADTVQRFMAHDREESWTNMIGNIQRTDDPGYTFISTIMHQRINHRCDQHC